MVNSVRLRNEEGKKKIGGGGVRFFCWNVDYMSDFSKPICLTLTTSCVSGLLASTTPIINSIFHPDAQTCHYSQYLCVWTHAYV